MSAPLPLRTPGTRWVVVHYPGHTPGIGYAVIRNRDRRKAEQVNRATTVSRVLTDYGHACRMADKLNLVEELARA